MKTARIPTGVRRAARGAVAAFLLALLLSAAAMASAHRATHERAGNSWSTSLDSMTANVSS